LRSRTSLQVNKLNSRVLDQRDGVLGVDFFDLRPRLRHQFG
jgi:hypothetical protein